MYKLTMTRRVLGVATVAMILAATAAVAQTPPTRIRGQIEKVDGDMLTIKARDGSMIEVKIADDARVAALVKATLDDIKPDTYVGVAGIPQPDGSVQAFSIHVLLPAARGSGEGERLWDAQPNSTMTNAYVANMVEAKDGHMLTVKHKDGEKKVVVTPATVIAKVMPGDKSELKAGTPIIILASQKQPDGSVLVKVMYYGRDIAPAM